ncbi:MAG: class I SAM-dependent methyltransferase [Parcubacteria group bacterium]|nr:class I SAM-dependent methyltransferase [Parcubacteria group bacterium]
MQNLQELRTLISTVSEFKEEEFDEFLTSWHEIQQRLKDYVYVTDPRNTLSRLTFEFGWGAQSAQFVIDCIPHFQRILLENYKRKNELKLLDVGAGSGAGSNIFAILHSDHFVYSKISIDAIDYTAVRERWNKVVHPLLNYFVADVYDLPSNKWDIVFCSAVVEHVPNPQDFCKELIRVCKGFVFIYVPYNEINRIPSHINKITEDFFAEFNIESLTIIKSMAWHPAIPDDKMILAIVDCRNKN